MKLALVIYGTLDTLSGGYLYDRQFVAHLRANHCQVDVWSLPWRNYARHLGDNLRLSWAYTLANSGYDLILQDELNHPSLFWLNGYLQRWARCPIVSIVHHLRSSEEHPAHLLPLYRTIERTYLNTVDAFIYNSRTTRALVQRQLHRRTPHIVAYPAADHRTPPARAAVVDALTSRLLSREPLHLLFVGNLMPRKGLHIVLDALARLASRDWHLHIVGSPDIDPTYIAKLRQQAAILGLEPQLTWHGRVSDRALDHLLATSDLFVLPSYEGFGIVFLEAMAFGLPVLASDVGAAPEVICPGVNGYLIPHQDAAALAARINLLINNRVHLTTLGYLARQHYDQHPTWAESMQHVHVWLRELASNRPSIVE